MESLMKGYTSLNVMETKGLVFHSTWNINYKIGP